MKGNLRAMRSRGAPEQVPAKRLTTEVLNNEVRAPHKRPKTSTASTDIASDGNNTRPSLLDRSVPRKVTAPAALQRQA